MANEKSKTTGGKHGAGEEEKAADREDRYGDRLVVRPVDGSPPYWKDTGEAFDEEAWNTIQSIAVAPERAYDYRGKRVANPEIRFWVTEVQRDTDPDGTLFKNPFQGFVLAIFDKPKAFLKEQDDGADRSARRAAFVLLTSPTWVRTREKKIVHARAGEVIMVDVNASFSRELVQRASPKIDTEGNVLEIHEISVNPKKKVSFPKIVNGKSETWSAWRMDFYVTGRYLAGQQLIAIKAIAVVPSIPGDEDVGDDPQQLPAAKELPALEQGAAPASN